LTGACINSAVPALVGRLTLTAMGGALDGGVVTSSDGTWMASDGGPITTTRRWLRCAIDGGACVPLTVPGMLTGANLQTDATRAQGAAGDGLPTSSSVGTWSSTTNLVFNGGSETNTGGWNAYCDTGNMANFPSATRDTSQRKFGVASLKVTTNGAEAGQQVLTIPSVSASTPYVASGWVKGPAGAQLCIGVDELTAGYGYVRSFAFPPLITVATGGWQRITSAGTTSATTALLHVLFGTCAVTGQAISFWVDGVQVERGTMPTPYVETQGGSATRAQSMLSGPSALLALDRGWATFRVHPEWTSATVNQPFPQLLSAQQSSTDKLNVYYSRAAGAWSLERNNGTQNTLRVPRPDAGVDTVVAAWTPSALRLSISGAPFVTTAANEVPSGLPATFDLSPLDGEIAWVAFGAGALDDAQAAALHGFGDSDPPFQQLPPTTTLLWTADTLEYRAAVIGSSYPLTANDVGSTLVLEVTATNTNGSVTVTSAPLRPLP
jgi:hypothetical protein